MAWQGAQARLAEGLAYASRYGNKIADAVDAVENWGEHALTHALVRSGLHPWPGGTMEELEVSTA
ncbi:hypothetical protein QQM39_24870 [Streptomyces sp. DT2A-34]|uniref:hypothetical protein n=1 Tax=Streptomyces sp. DT2A-34 TaxID=3051182 RepID=UPI00265BD4E3|nr:hypothetical protein [Streptomyces sp. DT2A-34]MDO0913944.1 hypothetical protein [Streptomyces sp. DT2A-34]